MCRRATNEQLAEGLEAFKDLFPINLGPLAAAAVLLLTAVVIL